MKFLFGFPDDLHDRELPEQLGFMALAALQLGAFVLGLLLLLL